MGGVLLPPGANRGARVWFHEEEYAAFFMLGDHAIHNLGLYLVHAEMNALALAARRGIALAGARLCCTTFPCHVCARHLLGAGLSEVVYIEPYPKSLAERLYPGAIVLGETGAGDHLAFRPFTGVAPVRYLELFGYGRRKDEQGFAVPWDPKSSRPRMRRVANPHLLAEAELRDTLLTGLVERGWAPSGGS